MARRSSMPCVWSAWSCVKSTASTRSIPAFTSCSRSSGGVSIRIRVPPFVSTTAPTLVRRSRGSGERQTAQWQPSCGTPKLVPVPRKVSFIGEECRSRKAEGRVRSWLAFRLLPSAFRLLESNRLYLQSVRRPGHIERHPRRHHDLVPGLREIAPLDRLQRHLNHLVVAIRVRHELRY